MAIDLKKLQDRLYDVSPSHTPSSIDIGELRNQLRPYRQVGYNVEYRWNPMEETARFPAVQQGRYLALPQELDTSSRSFDTKAFLAPSKAIAGTLGQSVVNIFRTTLDSLERVTDASMKYPREFNVLDAWSDVLSSGSVSSAFETMGGLINESANIYSNLINKDDTQWSKILRPVEDTLGEWANLDSQNIATKISAQVVSIAPYLISMKLGSTAGATGAAAAFSTIYNNIFSNKVESAVKQGHKRTDPKVNIYASADAALRMGTLYAFNALAKVNPAGLTANIGARTQALRFLAASRKVSSSATKVAGKTNTLAYFKTAREFIRSVGQQAQREVTATGVKWTIGSLANYFRQSIVARASGEIVYNIGSGIIAHNTIAKDHKLYTQSSEEGGLISADGIRDSAITGALMGFAIAFSTGYKSFTNTNNWVQKNSGQSADNISGQQYNDFTSALKKDMQNPTNKNIVLKQAASSTAQSISDSAISDAMAMPTSPIAQPATVTPSPAGTPEVSTPSQAVATPSAPAVEPSRGAKEFPPVPDSYIKPLSEYSDKMYHETGAERARYLIDPQSYVEMTQDNIYMANDPDLAKGQGDSKGFLFEFNTEQGITGRIDMSKPTAEFLYEQNKGEFIARNNPQKTYQQSISSVTIKPGAMQTISKGSAARIKNALQSWTKTKNTDGSITYAKPDVQPVSKPIAQSRKDEATTDDIIFEMLANDMSVNLITQQLNVPASKVEAVEAKYLEKQLETNYVPVKATPTQPTAPKEPVRTQAQRLDKELDQELERILSNPENIGYTPHKTDSEDPTTKYMGEAVHERPSKDVLGFIANGYSATIDSSYADAKTTSQAGDDAVYKRMSDASNPDRLPKERRSDQFNRVMNTVRESFVKTFLRGSTPDLDWADADLRFNIVRFRQLSRIASKRSVVRTSEIYSPIEDAKRELFDQARVLISLHEDIYIHKLYPEGRELPFGIKDIEQFNRVYSSILQQVNDSKNIVVKKALARSYKHNKAMEEAYNKAAKENLGLDTSALFSREHYLKHLVLDYYDELSNNPSFKKSMSSLFKRRTGSSKDILTNAEIADFLTFAALEREMLKMELLGTLKKYAKPIETDKTGQIIVPPGHKLFRAQDVGLYIPENVMVHDSLEIQKAILEAKGIPKKSKEAQRILTRAIKASRNKLLWVVPENVANAILKELIPAEQKHPVAQKLLRAPVSWWKHMQIRAPHTALRYQIRNIAFDFEQNVMNLPGYKYLGRAMKELSHLVYKNEAVSPEIMEWLKQGGLFSHQTYQIVHEPSRYGVLKTHNPDGTPRKSIDIVKDINKTYGLENFFTYRENILRYMQYLYFSEHVKKYKGGPLPYYFGSVKRYIDNLTTDQSKAFVLSEGLNQDYADVAPWVQWMSGHAMPFIKGRYANLVRTAREFNNAFIQDNEYVYRKGYDAIGKEGLNKINYSLHMIMRVGKVIASLMAMTAMRHLWNETVMKEYKKDIPEGVRSGSYLIVGHWDGRTHYIANYTGFLQNFELIGMGDLFNDIKRIANGEMEFKKWKNNMVESYSQELTSLYPLTRTVFEAMYGKKAFPAMGPIRDRWKHLFDNVGLGPMYDAAMNRPQQDGRFKVTRLLLSSSMKNEGSYYELQSLKSEYMTTLGKPQPDFGINRSARSQSLYYFRQAVRLNDKDAAEIYLAKYVAAGGTSESISQSLRALHPLNGLTDSERKDFIKLLNDREKKTYDYGIKYYEDMVKDIQNMMKSEEGKKAVREGTKTAKEAAAERNK